jgi:hypothetical protein
MVEEQEQDLKKLMAENRQMLEEIHKVSSKTAHYLKWLRIMDALKLLLILIPIVAAWLFLPDLISSFNETYGNLIPGLGR